ncbi:cathepsin L-like proteinase [Diabrotica virgifera virgifera]|uniref:Cathepsin L-like proteinase n=1 Tax=Diabrotica virgifera virgifera TaxID=50390 RepID=A0A6P7G4M4_DIAVI|nr:cathepsin L-like proteinase [Diabrotica virgifera virgifera]
MQNCFFFVVEYSFRNTRDNIKRIKIKRFTIKVVLFHYIDKLYSVVLSQRKIRMKLFILAALIVATSANLGAFEKWTSFKATHNKSYSLVEDKLRFAVFQENLKKIEEHNAKYENGEETYYLAVNQFADWSSAEFKALLNSQIINRPELSFIETYEADPNVELASSVDWRNKAVLGVKNQGSCGSCWAFSATGALEGQLAIHKNQKVPLSEQELVDCDSSNSGCNGGLMTNAFAYVKSHGLASEKQYAYTGRDGSCKRGSRTLSTISGYVNLAKTEAALASALSSVGPVSIAVDADTWQLYGGGIFNNKNCGTSLNHGVLAVGYTNDVFIVKNSWGTSWGELGYIRISRGHNLCGLNQMNSYPKL